MEINLQMKGVSQLEERGKLLSNLANKYIS